MKALVIVAHGSRRQASNDEVSTLSKQIASEVVAEYPLSGFGFLELAEPLIPEAIEQCIQAGATDISVLPYFLSAGRHVQEDVPAEVQKTQNKYPHLNITILPHIGGMSLMKTLICDAVSLRP